MGRMNKTIRTYTSFAAMKQTNTVNGRSGPRMSA